MPRAAPPAALRESILAQARAATASRSAMPAAAARQSRPAALASFWAWLARPPVASGFAGLMAAVLVGLMWWDQPMDLARPAPASPAAERAAPAPETSPTAATPTAATPATAPTVATPAPTPPAPALAETTPAPAMGARAPAASAERDRSARPTARGDTAGPQAFPSAESKAAAAAAPRERGSSGQAGVAHGGSAADVAASDDAPTGEMPDACVHLRLRLRRAPAQDAAPRAARVQPPEAPVAAAPVAPDTSTAAPAQAASPRRERQRGGAAGEARREPEPGRLRHRAPSRRTLKTRRKRADPSVANQGAVAEAARPLARRDAARPLATLLASLASDPSRWSRRAPDGTRSPLDDATRRWLADLDAAASGRWTAAAGARATGPAAGRSGRRRVVVRAVCAWC